MNARGKPLTAFENFKVWLEKEIDGNVDLKKKLNQEFKDWLQSVYPNPADQKTYLLQNHIDSDVSLDFEDFIDFFEKRKLKLKNLLQTTLNVTQEESETK